MVDFPVRFRPGSQRGFRDRHRNINVYTSERTDSTRCVSKCMVDANKIRIIELALMKKQPLTIKYGNKASNQLQNL